MEELHNRILEYLDCDHDLIAHYENTYHIRAAEIKLLRQKLYKGSKENPTTNSHEIMNIPTKPSKTLKEYNEWRVNGLKEATVEEKLQWNNIRKQIIQYEKWISENPNKDCSVNNSQNAVDLDGSLQIERLELENHELWTQIVNYRTTLNIGNTIRFEIDKFRQSQKLGEKIG